MVIFSFIASLIALALPWDVIKDANLAKLVERVGVGSATETEWGIQNTLAYLISIVWLVPIFSVLRGGSNAKIDLVFSFLPLLLLVITGCVFGTNYGPMLCLLGALTLPCGIAKFHHPGKPVLLAFGSILTPPRPQPEDSEDNEAYEDFSDRIGPSSPEEKLYQTDSTPKGESLTEEVQLQTDHRDSEPPEPPRTDPTVQEEALEQEAPPQKDHQDSEPPEPPRTDPTVQEEALEQEAPPQKDHRDSEPPVQEPPRTDPTMQEEALEQEAPPQKDHRDSVSPVQEPPRTDSTVQEEALAEEKSAAESVG